MPNCDTADALLADPPSVVRIRPDWTYETVSRGSPASAALFESLDRLSAPATRADFTLTARLREVFEIGCPLSFRLQLNTGTEARHFDVHLYPESSDAGARVHVLGTCFDVTDEVAAGPAAYHTRQRFEALLSHVPGFCYTVDEDLVFTSSVGSGLGRLGLAPGELVGKSLLELWGTSEPDYEPFACHRAALAGQTATYRDVCMGRSLEYQLWPLRNAAAAIVGVIGVGLDVTERDSAKEHQVKLAERLRQVGKMEAIGRLAGGVAHDFNNLLTCIIGNLTLAERHMSVDNDAAARHLSEASSAADSAAALTRQLLAFGRRQVIAPRTLNPSSLVLRVEGMLRRLIGESIELRTSCAEDLWNVEADAGQLEQALVNLVVNARDAISDHGEICIETRNLEIDRPLTVGLGHLKAGQYVVLSVSDNGQGMSDAVRERLFEPFFTTKPAGYGTGLGLATVQGAVEQSGGVVAVESTLGGGTTFQIFLPRSYSKLVDAHARQRPTAPADAPGGSERILLVEDDPLVLEFAHCALQQLGYDVLPCSSTDEALRTLADQTQPVDLLLTDVVMPHMNGKELAARVSALAPGIAVLYCSGYGESVVATLGDFGDTVNFIAKPFRLDELALKVRAVLDGDGPEAISGVKEVGSDRGDERSSVVR
ncbi:MAG TPA: ATP-binding protein [Polyangiaceae bacterium]|nr:ATP-binding protein [Polyangiaceae bacterium]